MDELTVMQSFRAERDIEPPETREAVRHALEAHIEAAASEARNFGEALASSTPPARLSGERAGLRSRRRRLLLLFAGAAAATAALAVVLVQNDGPTAQPASAAEILHGAAAAAAATPATSVPGPGQFLFRKERRLEVEAWRYPLPPEGRRVGVAEVSDGTMSGPHAFNAMMPRTVESWTGQNGGGRSREVAGTPKFWSPKEEAHWKAAGSPLPPPFNAEYQRRFIAGFPGVLELGPRVVDTGRSGFGNFHFPDTSKLPTEPKALRRAVEGNEIEVVGFHLVDAKAAHLDTEETKKELINILQEGEATPALQAATFDALAELPGMKVDDRAVDRLGRHGDAIVLGVKNGIREEYIFSPASGEVLATRRVLVDPAAAGLINGPPAGTTFSERDYIEEGTVGSINEAPRGAEGTGPVATTDPALQK
jgi:hypothetical protein